MSLKRHLRSTLVVLALAGLIAPEADAIEIFTAPSPVAHMDNGLITQVRGGGGMRRGGGGGMRAGGMRGGGGARFAGGAHRGGAYRGRAGYGYRGGARY